MESHTRPLARCNRNKKSYLLEEAEGPDDKPPSHRRNTVPRMFSGVTPSQWSDWRWQFRTRITTVDQLNRFLPLTADAKAPLTLTIATYPMAITPYYLSLI